MQPVLIKMSHYEVIHIDAHESWLECSIFTAGRLDADSQAQLRLLLLRQSSAARVFMPGVISALAVQRGVITSSLGSPQPPAVVILLFISIFNFLS